MADHAGDADSPTAGAESLSAGASAPNDRIESRLRAVERAVTGNDARPADVADDATATAERERLESRLDDLEERVAELEAATQAVRGYVGAVRAVNREVERRADLALSRATAAERGNDADGAVPSESALDAALPDDRPSSGGRSNGDGGAGRSDGRDSRGGSGDGDDGDGGAWAEDALSRLRESL
ncbi:DUF7310 family coiled-coil domain-containing protein [Halorubrum tebenquichense]|uniref:DUF7310 domain-containing protein n=1 Tax=Halorubrum tebenquichense DSM 14210 TaxID=1227485 RepID=M0DRN0_9EURY|nr:hypothetical protein [Halorubrum tebenquichense]ELZ37483.1 hypothetical protein C472_08504 [Halorubrum tebenquichense DSM 14210]